MATTDAGASHGTTRNNGATVVYGGNIDSSTTVTQALSKETTGFHSGLHGAKVPAATATSGTAKPYSGGTFAYNQIPGQFIGMRFTGYVSGVANTVLERGAGGGLGRRSVHWLESYRRLNITSWDYVTGAATTGGSAGASVTYKNIRGSGSVDDAAHPSRAVPGEYVFTDHSLAKSGTLAVALSGDYPAKTD